MDVNALTREIANKLGLEKAAESDARAGVPARDAAAFAGAETEAVEAARKAGREEAARLGEHCRKAENAAAKCEQTLADVRKQRQNAETGSPPEADLDIPRRERDRAESNYLKFQQDHDLDRGVGDDDRFVRIVVTLAVVLVEGGLNSYFFAPAFERGLLGGFFVAFFFSIVNVGGAFVGGAFGLRHLNHRDPWKQMMGLFGFLFCLAVCAVTVALSAWFRGHVDSLRKEDIDALELSSLAWDKSLASLQKADIWGLFSSLNSFLLVFVGALCAIVGFWEGREYDDPYPGFGKMRRLKEEAQDRLDEAQEAHNSRLREWRQNHGGTLREMTQTLQNDAAKMQTVVDGARQAAANAADLRVQTSRLAHGLLSLYRVKNTAIRATSPPPYFVSQFPEDGEFQSIADECNGNIARTREVAEHAARLLRECRDEAANIRRTLSLE